MVKNTETNQHAKYNLLFLDQNQNEKTGGCGHLTLRFLHAKQSLLGTGPMSPPRVPQSNWPSGNCLRHPAIKGLMYDKIKSDLKYIT